ncbi:hypothetical protein A2U01_0019043 [Trifolium medium]|uniref:Uncharacterized protein n=1 Tax=Trifolium medium TaxID=97028 RepID=A0A392NHS5_9FABA|nr:hypothetical protein [Trifolium medium]
MTLGSSSCVGETFVTVFVICEAVLAYGILMTRRDSRSTREEFATRRGSCTRRCSCNVCAFARVKLMLHSRGRAREYLCFVCESVDFLFVSLVAWNHEEDAWSVGWDLKRQMFRLMLPHITASEKASLWPKDIGHNYFVLRGGV